MIASPQPTFPLDYPNDEWVCPILGDALGPIPKTYEANLLYRNRLLERASEDKVLQLDIMAACTKSPLFWLNVFGWTARPKMICSDGRERSAGAKWVDENGDEQTVPPVDQPIITWPAQDHLVTELVESMHQGGLVLVPKSRDQGATIIVMGVDVWALLFWPQFTALITSRNEALVDGGADEEGQLEGSLFGKVDYMLAKLPPWMYNRKKLKRKSKPIIAAYRKMGSSLRGESANADIGQSLRTTLVVLDEASRFPHGARMMTSLESVGACQVLMSTPDGPGTTFSKLCLKAETPEGREHIKLLTLSYTDSPTHGRGRKWTIDEDGSITGTVKAGYWETPAFKRARATSPSPKRWRENWLIDHETSGLLVLNSQAISRLRRGVKMPRRGKLVLITKDDPKWVKPPRHYTDDPQLKFVDDSRGHLFVWELPRSDTVYVIGGDFGHGVDQSATVFPIMDAATGIIVAEYVDASIDPYESVPIAINLGYFYRGQQRRALICWETNGPGASFGRMARRAGYHNLYRKHQEGAVRDTPLDQLGWLSTEPDKIRMFEDFNEALCSGEFTTYSDGGLDDMSQWLFDDFGRIVAGSRRDETIGAQARHGDLAIGYGLCVKARRSAPRIQAKEEYEPNPCEAGRWMEESMKETFAEITAGKWR